MKTLIKHLLAACFFLAAEAFTQELGDVALHQALLDVGNPFRLLCVAAHPDDEDGATLAYYRMKYGVETHAVVATRGEGGQNESGPELYAELGVIRTREMMAAAAVEGARLHFLDLPEFGYSKTREETEAVWGKNEALRRVVGIIRRVRPHVIITHHGRMKDHGHHQAIGAAVLEAFDAAADPSAFPTMGAPWQASRLFIRAWKAGPQSLENDISELEPARGKTYAEIAAEALRKHKSQGMQFFIDRYLTGRPKTWYDLVKGEAVPPASATGLFPGFFAGLALPGGWSEEDVAAWRALTAHRGEPDFARRVRATAWPGGSAPRDARSRLMACLYGLRLALYPDDRIVISAQNLKVRGELRDFGARDFAFADFTLDAPGMGPAQSARRVPFDDDGVAVVEFNVPVSAGALTLPAADHLYQPVSRWKNLRLSAKIEAPKGSFPKKNDGAPPFRPISTATHVDVAPPLMITPRDAPLLMTRSGDHMVLLRLLLTNYAPSGRTGTLSLVLPRGWRADDAKKTVSFARGDEQRQVSFRLEAPPDLASGVYSVALTANTGYKTAVAIRVVDLAIPKGRHVGIVQSYDDTFAKTLTKMGVSHALIAPGDFTPALLDRFTTIIIDIRAYLNRPDLVSNNQALLDYVARGGSVMVMYQKTYEWKPAFAPYPIRLSHNRVTRENAPVTLLEPDHALFNTPNRILPADWDGWRQERGLYFPDQWDPAFTPLIACVDPGEEIPPGGCLIARYGRGVYLYTALGWYRQLRDLHPGALRVFANMLAL